ncbi:Ldh family oxidoreductase [Lentzea albidocapillata]|uniref:Malate/lactate/ureidoglycolate dehydrogenase, LDH2 family n=1 Tax=Lentzea albidocapillata TaxID=40571 RepID=A0A1W1ZMQ5_9PSEU|nr:Ldh family oxidoreductase [Lentzea albidocapillata]SMC49533.1 Malate/lactate/ureidoglycolate dehydrogenase, LDH2 family [Lentzea albidocapillata]
MTVLVPYRTLLSTVADVFAGRGMPADRAMIAAEALCHGELTGMTSHGLVNLTRLYLPLFDDDRTDPLADTVIQTDLGASVLVDARRALGLWSAGQAMELACARASRHGIAMVSVRGATHIGCAGHHAARAVPHGMIGLIASNCGGQRIARPPGGAAPMLGTNPLALACPAGDAHPFVLDMSTTVVPTGRVRAAARAGEPIPPGWLAAADGTPVTDPAAFDRGDAHLLWLGSDPETGAYKGFGLGLLVEVLAALVSGAALGALSADGDRDDDIGILAVAIAPDLLRTGFAADAASLFTAVRGWPALDPAAPVSYPGWHEGERAARLREHGVPLPRALFEELRSVTTGVHA